MAHPTSKLEIWRGLKSNVCSRELLWPTLIGLFSVLEQVASWSMSLTGTHFLEQVQIYWFKTRCGGCNSKTTLCLGRVCNLLISLVFGLLIKIDHCSIEHVHLFILHLAVHKSGTTLLCAGCSWYCAFLMVELVTADPSESFWSKHVNISGSCSVGVCILDKSRVFHSRELVWVVQWGWWSWDDLYTCSHFWKPWLVTQVQEWHQCRN